jgi:ribosomal peptide maturation radical SAM protein 1
MHFDGKKILLISMPFAGVNIPSIQLAILEGYLEERNIEIKTKNLYLKAAEIYGINFYNYLIYPPNDSYTAQLIFSKYLFPDYWLKKKEEIKDFYNIRKQKNIKLYKDFTFENYELKTDIFYQWILENLNWKDYDIIGFSLNYGQFLPSLSFAKEIKKQNPEKKIILGGSRTVGNLGINVLKTFDFIDFIISGDGEESLYRILSDFKNFKSIPGVIYREDKDVIWNKNYNNININELPIPSYNTFYKELSNITADVQQFFRYYGYLPIEISRGCWWNKCSFCNMNLQHEKYREKNIDKIIEEIKFLSDKYKMLNFQIIGNTLPAKNCRELFKNIIKLRKDFNFVAEVRADQLLCDDYSLLKEAGFTTIQTGIESFSSSYLKKMNKGTRVIDNIAALKYSKENGIINKYNLIIDYPNEESIDFEETKKTTNIFKQYLEPPQLCNLRILYGSPIHCNPTNYNISNFEYAKIDKFMFPQNILEKNISFIYSFTNINKKDENKWEQLIDNWKISREMIKIEGVTSENITNQLVFYYVDGGDFVKIYDKRNLKNIRIYNLNEIERKIFLACIDITSYNELKEYISDITEEELNKTLKIFKECDIVYEENNFYLSLPLNYTKCLGRYKTIESNHKNISLKVCPV